VYVAKDHRRALVGAGLGVAVGMLLLALVFWSRPTGKVVVGLALALLVVLAIIEFLGRPVEAAPPPRPAPE
jgi:high-affinity Fe2+/Pb2+ permease